MIRNEPVLTDEKKLAIIKELRLIDDAFFAVCFDKDTELTGWMLRIILERDDLTVTEVKTQYSIKGLGGHSVILDALATDQEGRLYNIEVQKPDEGAIPRRARFYGGLIDSAFLKKGQKYKDLCETYVIFITENDVLGDNMPVYHIERTIQENGKRFDDGLHIVYVNASHTDSTPLGMLMHDFMCYDPKEMNYHQLSTKTDYFKNEKGEQHMCQLLEEYIDYYKDRIAEAETRTAEAEMRTAQAEARTAQIEAQIAKAEERTAQMETKVINEKNQIALRLVKKGFTIEESAETTGLPVEEVKKLAQQMM
ncbi:MAG: Rpn family recombination-promoting nuclease/putative transposase [Clostridia bacterium]|nr:Rpn family recombination-promoting nuclease/putative transposase [Clostridia bacterium]